MNTSSWGEWTQWIVAHGWEHLVSFFLFRWWWIIRLPGYLLKSLKVQIGCFTSQICRLKSWIELRIWEPFISHSIRALTFISQRKTRNNFKRGSFYFFRRIIFLHFCFPEREENIFILFVFFRERSQNISLFFRERILIERDFIKKIIYIYF